MRVTGRHEMTSVTSNGAVESVQVTLQPVYGKGEDDANAEWSRWTPSGELRLLITNPVAYEQLKLGACYYVDLNPAE
jgi:hypothetical protein